jgi:hypothetical protein
MLISIRIYPQKATKLILDLDIKAKCIKNINTSDFATDYSIDSSYQTTFKAKRVVADTVDFNYLDNEFLKKTFMCNHHYVSDTLIINGGFGPGYQMYGFIAKVFPNRMTLIKLRLYWPYPSYYNSLDETYTKSEIVVETKRSKLILNKLPTNKSDRSHIYGYIEFLSNDYFIKMKDEKTKKSYKQKTNSEYRIYFDSRYLNDTE